jgi:hypothetical protein
MPGLVAGEHRGWKLEVAGQLHLHQLRREKQEQGGVQLSALNRRRPLQQRAELNAEDVDHLHSCRIGADGAERFEVGLARLSSNNEELPDACPLLPGLDKFVHHPVKRTAAERGSARKRPSRGVHPIFDGGGADHTKLLGQIVR